ncbi:MAG: hypothetical protein Kow0069_30740 [Promethearchaeota archaeon]
MDDASFLSFEGKRRTTTSALAAATTVVTMLDWAIGFRLSHLFAQNNALVVRGEVWRLFASVFVHADLVHLSSNLFGLFLFGVQVENELGGRKELAAYFLSGWAANAFGLLVTPPWVFSLGASGCVFGLVGAFFAGFGRVDPGALAIGLSFVALFVALSVGPGVDVWAHASGALVGALLGLAWAGREQFDDVY